ncbi:phytoene desaturase family protein [Clostridium cellulovorans]|uniref:Amine oxidase n=1 Tax=Clostridium cellulovorans (strain ATCC 35296 / DSM 3052 / OCM 3 / 743B) TaxID=573061 RepID=D9SQG3_CLOC7|nr:NAD(P)/FAD-dependent oxidoreductase [Clostridium cellulovorans]ADL50230.1 amine oxidase [Clostridium cellulovorans 743B]
MKKIIIIGAGISGLSAGCYGQMKGYETEIFELQGTVGGLCTTWNRKGYLIDGCIDWLIGINPDNYLYDSWKELGVFEGDGFIQHDYSMQVEDGLGKKLILYSDINKLEEHLLQLSPIDEPLIKELSEAIRISAFSSKTVKPVFNKKFATMSLYDFLQQFKDRFLREALGVTLIPLQPKEYPVGTFIFRHSFYNRKDASWSIGGSLAFAQRIENKYKALGGKINYRVEVQEVIVKDNKAVGVRLADGSEHYADYVISTIDGYKTVFDLLKGKYLNDEIKQLFNEEKDLPSSMQISLGIHCDLSEEPHNIVLKLKEPFVVGDKINSYLYLKQFSFDKLMCKPGKSVITSIIETDYEYWDDLHKDIYKYNLEKERLCEIFIKIIEERFPQVKGKIEVTDVATPVTYNRYTGVWKGSYLGWWNMSATTLPAVLPGLENFYIAGQWAEALGGLPISMMTGKGVITKISEI